jgi:hypothetical protein
VQLSSVVPTQRCVKYASAETSRVNAANRDGCPDGASQKSYDRPA